MSSPAEHSVFNYQDYKKYLGDRLSTTGSGRGLRSKLAEALGCQTAFISQVLNGHSHFSLEHAVQINRFLEHSRDESHYFMLIVHYGRAGSKALEQYYLEQMREIHQKRQVVRERIQVKQSISAIDQMTYYSSWLYSAMHIMLSVPRFHTKAAIAEHLGLPVALVSECLEFLASCGLAVQEGSRYRIGEARIHLGKDSPMISKHHANWRMRSIQSQDQMNRENFYYSSVISLSREDAERIRAILLSTLEKTEPILKASKEEEVYGFLMDFFRV